MEVSFPRQYLFLFDDWRNKLVEGGRGGAKSTSYAKALLQKGRCEKLRIYGLREHQNSIRESVHYLFVKIIHQYKLYDYEIFKTHIANKVTGTTINYAGMWMNIQNIKGLEDVDIAWIEEAQSVSQDSLDILIPTIRKPGSEIWYSLNRFAEEDPVWQTIGKNPDKNTYAVHVDMMDLTPKYQNPILMELMKNMKKKDYTKYLHVYKGEPLGQAPEAIIPREDIAQAVENDLTVTTIDVIMYGMDCARMGGDEIAFYKVQGAKVVKWETWINLETTDTERKWKEFVGDDKRCKQKIDMGNMGSGIHDHLKEEGYNVIGVNFGGRLDVKEKHLYYDIATEMWFNYADIAGQSDIPNDPMLRKELTGRKYFYKKTTVEVIDEVTGKKVKRECEVKIAEPKDVFKKNVGTADRSDGLILAYYKPFEEPKKKEKKAKIFKKRRELTKGFA